MIYLIYITAFILGIILGRETKDYPIKLPDIKLPQKKIKVLHKAEPITYDQKRAEAIKEGKPIIKTFHK